MKHQSNIMILITGMPATGKTSLAKWLSSKLCVPLVCYDNIKKMMINLAKKNIEYEEQQNNLFRMLPPIEFFWFNCEEIMKTGSILIIEYFFTDQMKKQIDDLVQQYQYNTINIHLDAPVEVAHRRFHERNESNPEIEGMRPKEIPFDKFEAGTKANKDFRYGEHVIYVDSTDFETVSYENIYSEMRRIAEEIKQ